MPRFTILTLGCKVNQYESEQIATLLRARGWEQTESVLQADLCVVNTCSVTLQAAGKSRQTIRRLNTNRGSIALPVLESSDSQVANAPAELEQTLSDAPSSRVLVTGCWATSNPREAAELVGAASVIGHHDDVATRLEKFLSEWSSGRENVLPDGGAAPQLLCSEHHIDEIKTLGGMPAGPTVQNTGDYAENSRSNSIAPVKSNALLQQPDERLFRDMDPARGPLSSLPLDTEGEGKGEEVIRDAKERLFSRNPRRSGSLTLTLSPGVPGEREPAAGTVSLPLLDAHQTGHQRAFLKIQDGCDAHCTYCIIPTLRPTLWSKPVQECVTEARNLIASGHKELVLTGIFLGAYGQPTALRRRQHGTSSEPLGRLIETLCTQVPGLRRLRLSSLEPGDLTTDLIRILKSFPQVVPHFHLPLQSGSDPLLRRMNRQYTRDDFLRMVERVHDTFDRPAITTDIIVGFPGETDDEFSKTLEIVDRVKFIHTHAFSYSPRPGTAAARWTQEFVRGPVVNDRIAILRERAVEHSFEYRQQFVGETVELLVERPGSAEIGQQPMPGYQHGRCERYFPVHFPADRTMTGQSVRVRIELVTRDQSLGSVIP